MQSKQTCSLCQSIFKDGKSKPTAEEFTQKWIALINQLEQEQASAADKQLQRNVFQTENSDLLPSV